MDDRLPAHLEVSGLIRQTEAAGGFATVLRKGEKDAGTILLVLTTNGQDFRAYERIPNADGARSWSLCRTQDIDNEQGFSEYLDRRCRQDRDLWIVELDIANGERLIGLSTIKR